MQIEAFSRGKIHASPDDNEDAFVLVPGRFYAVIDGATDRLGTRYNGMYAGRYAALLVKQTLEEQCFRNGGWLPDLGIILEAINERFQLAYRDHGILEQARHNATYRFTATLVLAEHKGDQLALTLIGDSGIRINGSMQYQMTKDLDHVTAVLRQAGWQHLQTLPLADDEREAASRRLCFQGLGFLEADHPCFDTAARARIRDVALARACADLPHVPQPLIGHLLDHGIVHGQHVYQNNDTTCLGYAALDGFAIPAALIATHVLATDGVDSIELFSDGYFDPPDGFGVAAWEASHQAVERIDPAKVLRWLGQKGTTPAQWTDDRTYLGIKMRV